MDIRQQTFGERIRALRKRRGITQTWCALQMGVKVQRWNEMERGRQVNPRLTTIRRVAAVLGVSAAALLAE